MLFREDATVDDLIDVIEGNRKYMKCIYVYNKIDVVGIDDVDRLARQPNSVVISCNMKVFQIKICEIHLTADEMCYRCFVTQKAHCSYVILWQGATIIRIIWFLTFANIYSETEIK